MGAGRLIPALFVALGLPAGNSEYTWLTYDNFTPAEVTMRSALARHPPAPRAGDGRVWGG